MIDNPSGRPAVQDDPIVAEVRAAREAIFAEAHFDLDELGQQLRVEQAVSERRVISRAPRRVRTDSAA